MNSSASNDKGIAPDISVIVCTRNRAEKLDSCLRALARQTITDRLEVIVVDDGPDARTAEVAHRYPVRLLRHETNQGLARARNTGIRAATAPIVAFTDDDCVPADDWVEQLLAGFTSEHVVAVGGSVVGLRRTTLVHRYLADTNRLSPLESELGVSNSIAYRAVLYIGRNLRRPVTRPDVRPVHSIVGASMSFRRDALLTIGLFDARIRFGGEDEDICRRLRNEYPTSQLMFTERAVIAHDYDGELRDALRRSYQYGAGGARSFLKNGDKYPTLFPAPVLIAGLVVAGLRHRWAWGLAALVPLTLCARWPVEAARRRRAEVLTYPWIQMLEETAHDVGFVQNWVRLRSEYADSSRSMPADESLVEAEPDLVATA